MHAHKLHSSVAVAARGYVTGPGKFYCSATTDLVAVYMPIVAYAASGSKIGPICLL